MSDLNVARGDSGAIYSPEDGYAYAFGGFTDANNFNSPLLSTEQYDPETDKWVLKKSMSVGRGDKACVALHHRIFLVAGESKFANGTVQPLKHVEVYNRKTNAWNTGGTLPTHRFRFAGTVHNDSIYVFGGQGYLTNGSYGTVGSYFPIVGNVDQYHETVVSTSKNAATMVDLSGTIVTTLLISVVVNLFM